MSKITSLAPETLRTILQHLSQRDLLSTARTCRTLLPHAEPLLYRTITHTINQSPRNWMRLPQIIHTLALRPELALHVKHINIYYVTQGTLRSDVYKNEGLGQYAKHVDFNALDTIFAAMHTFHEVQMHASGTVATDFRTRLGLTGGKFPARNISDALVTILFSLVPNLEVLNMDWAFACDAICTHTFLNHANCACMRNHHHGFPKLRSLSTSTLTFNGNETATAFHGPLLYFGLSIQNLYRLDLVLGKEYISLFESLFPNSLVKLDNLRELRLNSCHDNIWCLKEMLASTPNLQRLEYHQVEPMTPVRIRSPLTPLVLTAEEEGNGWAAFVSAILPLAGTLRELVISLDDLPCCPSPIRFPLLLTLGSGAANVRAWRRKGRMGSLRAFTALKTLELPIFVLLGWDPEDSLNLSDVLPLGLRDLCFRDDLVDGDLQDGYRWMPWFVRLEDPDMFDDDDMEMLNESQEAAPIEYSAMGHLINYHSFERICSEYCNPSLIIDQIESYLLYTPHKLDLLTIKTIQGRSWPVKYACQLAAICNRLKITCKFHGRLTNSSDEVRQTTISEIEWPRNGEIAPWTQYKFHQRLILESRGGFYARTLGVRSEEELIAELEELVYLGWFANIPARSVRSSGQALLRPAEDASFFGWEKGEFVYRYGKFSHISGGK